MKLKRHKVQHPASPIAIVESLIEFRKESSKARGKNIHEHGDCKGDRGEDQLPRDKDSGEKG